MNLKTRVAKLERNREHEIAKPERISVEQLEEYLIMGEELSTDYGQISGADYIAVLLCGFPFPELRECVLAGEELPNMYRSTPVTEWPYEQLSQCISVIEHFEAYEGGKYWREFINDPCK